MRCIKIVDRTEPEKLEENKEKKHSIPIATLKRILRENGIDRISKDALEEVAMMLQDIIRDLANNAVVFTKHRNAKTTTKDDILLATR